MAIPLSSPKLLRDWIKPFPYVCSPIKVDLSLSCKDPASISLALAVPLLTKVTMGPSNEVSFCEIIASLMPFLFFVSTTGLSLKKESATAIPELTNPPELFLRSSIIPSTSFCFNS